VTGKPDKTGRMIVSRVKAALKEGRPVLVDGTRISGVRFNEGELEVNWWDAPEYWTVVQPSFLSGKEDEAFDGKLLLNTHW
jgi:hypothetical protein